MSSDREIWLGDGEPRKAVPVLRKTKVVLPVPNPAIKFYRGDSWFLPAADGEAGIETPVIAALDKKVLGWLHRHGDRPEAACVLAVEVDEPAATGATLAIATAQGSKSFPMSRSGVPWRPATRFVLMYGDDADLQGARFDGLELLDVSGGSFGFETTLEFSAAGHKRELGVIDVLIQGEGESAFRTARFAIAKGVRPKLKLVAPRVGPNHLQVMLDDGDESTADELDVTKLVDPAGEVTDWSEPPEAVQGDSAKVKGTWEAAATRSRVYADPPEAGEVAVLLHGENRVRVLDGRDGRLLYAAHFLLYAKDDETVPLGGAVTEEEVEAGGQTVRVGRSTLALDFAEKTADADLSRYLHSLRLRPRGLLREAGYVQAGTPADMGAAALRVLLDRILGFKDPLLTSGALDVRMPVEDLPSATLEALPAAFRDTAEFNLGGGGFANAEPHFFHHFYMHTFPAHRLVDRIRFPDADPPAITLSGAHFDLDKTFVLPTAKDEVRGIVKARKEHAARKLAIFGHTDASGSDAYNNELSRRRGRTAFALLTHDADEWMHRLDNSPGTNERPWGTREVQHMLKHLGFYAGTVDGIKGDNTKRGIRDFQTSKGMPADGNDNPATRRALVLAYMEELTGEPLAAADFFPDAAGAPAVFACGEAFPVVQTTQPNAQNRRIVFVLRRTPGAPVDTAVEGAAVPFAEWLSQESDGSPTAETEAPDFVIGCADTGFGLNDDLRGDHANEPNRLFVRGKRLARPTDVNSAAAVNTVVFEDGDLRSITDSANMHGSAVMTSSVADGVGDDVGGVERTAAQVVLGTAKHSRFRPIRAAGDMASALRKYEVLAKDPEVKVITNSFLFQNVFNLVGTGAVNLTAAQRATLRTRIKNTLDAGKILFIAAANRNAGAFPGERDAARTEGGFLAPQRSQTRGSFAGANAFQSRIAVVGATSHVRVAGDPEVPSHFTYLGTEVNLAAPGVDIRVVSSAVPAAPAVPPAGQSVVNGVLLRPINGTSFSTPMTAGIAAEMMLVNPDLKQTANQVQVIEMLEATADLLPSLAAAPAGALSQGDFLPVAGSTPPPDPQLTLPDLADFRRVHFWKAILAAANGGIPTEAKLANGQPATSQFTLLTAKDHAATTWYGFEIRTRVQNANLWLRRADGSQIRLEDTGAALPDSRTFGSAWRLTQPLRAPATHANAGFRGFLLPAFPFAGSNLFMCQFSVKREELADFAELRLYPPDLDPVQQFQGELPPLAVLDLGQITRMRDPGAITAAERGANAALDQIATHVEEFDDFVFHVTVQPQPLVAFSFLHGPAAAVGETFDVRMFALDKFGNVKTDFAGNVNVFHDGTAGAAGANPTGVFINGAAAAAPVPIALANGIATFQVRAHTAETFRFTASDGAGHTERAGAGGVEVAVPGPLGSLRLEVVRFDDGADPVTHPPRIDDKLRFTVTALDTDGRTKTDYRGTVELSVVEGERGFDAAGNTPSKGGVQVADAIMDPLDPARFRHAFVAADAGKFDFPVFSYSATPVVLEVSDGTVTARSRRIEVKAGSLDHFHLDHPERATLGSGFDVAVTCRDSFENTIVDFEDRVRLTVAAGTAGAVSGAGEKSGVHIGDTSAAGDDFHEFEPGDRGVHNFRVTPYTAETIRLRAATDGGVQTDTTDIVVDGPGPLASLGVEGFGSQMTGVKFRVLVKALDASNRVITTFNGTVTAALDAGTAFAAAGPTGVRFHTPSHTYGAGDNGQFLFEFTAFTAETVRLRFTSGGASGVSANIQVT